MRERNLFRIFAFALLSHIGRKKKQRREAEKLLPRDNPRQSYEYFFDPKSWNFHSWKMVFRESHSTNREKEFRAFVKIVNSMLFVQQIKLHLLERLLANCNRIIDATRGSKWVVHWNRQQPNWLCLDFYLLLNVERAKNMFPNKRFAINGRSTAEPVSIPLLRIYTKLRVVIPERMKKS